MKWHDGMGSSGDKIISGSNDFAFLHFTGVMVPDGVKVAMFDIDGVRGGDVRVGEKVCGFTLLELGTKDLIEDGVIARGPLRHFVRLRKDKREVTLLERQRIEPDWIVKERDWHSTNWFVVRQSS